MKNDHKRTAERAYVVKRIRQISDEAFDLRTHYADSLKTREKNTLAALQMRAKEIADKLEAAP